MRVYHKIRKITNSQLYQAESYEEYIKYFYGDAIIISESDDKTLMFFTDKEDLETGELLIGDYESKSILFRAGKIKNEYIELISYSIGSDFLESMKQLMKDVKTSKDGLITVIEKYNEEGENED